MKKAAIIFSIACLLAGAVQADIGVRGRSDGGIYLAGGDWTNGPWPETGALYQLIWSPTAPVIGDLTLDEATSGKTGELILDSGAAGSYGYVAPTRLVEVFGAVNDAYIIMRIFQDATPEVDDVFYQSVAATPAPLTDYIPSDPSTIFDHFSTEGGAPQVTNGTIIPEPATLGLWGLGLATILIRRKIRR
jgi:hypothetical protein